MGSESGYVEPASLSPLSFGFCAICILKRSIAAALVGALAEIQGKGRW